jgi:hypothetical protein
MCCLFSNKYHKLKKIFNSEEYKTVINNKYVRMPKEDKTNIANLLKYVQSNIYKEKMPIENINLACIFNNCNYKYIYNEYCFNYKTTCGYIWSPMLIHYILVHNVSLTDDFIDFIYSFNSFTEKQKRLGN